MAAIKTRADSVREYLTGGQNADGEAQGDPNLSLGKYRSSVETKHLNAVVTNALPGITIDFISGTNGQGNGFLKAASINSVQWQKPGDASYGPIVTINAGETKVIEANNNPGAYIRITRSSPTPPNLTGTATVALTRVANNVYGFDDVTSAEAVLGDAEYRAVIARNEADDPITNLLYYLGTLGQQQASTAGLPANGGGSIVGADFSTWPQSGWARISAVGTPDTTQEVVYYSSRDDTTLTVPAAGRGRLGTAETVMVVGDLVDSVPGIAISAADEGIQSHGAQIEEIASENNAPAGGGIAWKTPISAAEAVNVGTLNGVVPGPGQQIGLWIWRDVPVGTQAIAQNVARIIKTYDAA